MKPTSTCSAVGCNAPIAWGVTEFDKRMPLDPEPTEDGRVIRVTRRDGRIVLHVLTGDELPWIGAVTDDVGPYNPHHRTCKHAARFRDPNGSNRCRVCRFPMNPDVTRIEGTDTHPCCDPAAGASRARQALRAATDDRQDALDLGDDDAEVLRQVDVRRGRD